MTLDAVINTVEDFTGHEGVTAATPLSELGLDSLEFLDLMVRCGVSNEKSQQIDTINDLYMVSSL